MPSTTHHRPRGGRVRGQRTADFESAKWSEVAEELKQLRASLAICRALVDRLLQEHAS